MEKPRPLRETPYPPWHVWLAFALVAFLRGLPFLITRLSHGPTVAYLPVGYIPKDWLQYVAIIREISHTGRVAFENPFTTDAQSGRFILFFHALLGQISRWTHLDPFWLLELSRIPLLVIFAWVLWRFITPILPDVRHRAWVCWLVALSGGLEFLLRIGSTHLPKTIADRTEFDLWHLVGWNTFESFYNPLWIAALILLLLMLQPLLKPGGPMGWKDALQSSLAFFVLFFSHPYTGIAALPIVAFYYVLRLIFNDRPIAASLLRTTAILLPILIVIGLISAWQNQDTVYKLSSSNVFGDQEVPVFWYPLTFGAMLVFTLLGWQRAIAAAHPWRFALGGWTLAIMFLHSCPLINGYKFAYLLYLPTCIIAAPVVSDTFGKLWPARQLAAIALGILLFFGNLQLAWTCIEEVQRPYQNGSLVLPDYLTVCSRLAAEPEGNVLSSANLGNVIPAYANDRVYVGQWFMTPEYAQKAAHYESLVKYLDSNERLANVDEEIREQLKRNAIRYLVLPARLAPRAQEILGATVARKIEAGLFSILDLKPQN